MTSAPIFIDTDIGVDDAAAIAWLLRAGRVIGFSTVFGNSTVEHSTRNLLTLLETAGSAVPVTVGAAAPLVGDRPRVSVLLHGADGFWGAQGDYQLSDLPHDAPAAIAAAARANRDLILVALGPLTNIALAAQRFPQDMAGIRLVALGGAWRGGNTTPVAEFNTFADPHALEQVLASQMRVELVTLDAFDQVVVEPQVFLAALSAGGGQVGALLARILAPYFEALREFDTFVPSLPDVAAAIYALRPDLGRAEPAMVRVITDDNYAYGQTIIGLAAFEKLRLVASSAELNHLLDQIEANGWDMAEAIGNLLAREPDNALVIRAVDGPGMAALLSETLCD
jgi:inosine-uridine nucleoside N-ribohydrolase